jgi:hypothetical protein
VVRRVISAQFGQKRDGARQRFATVVDSHSGPRKAANLLRKWQALEERNGDVLGAIRGLAMTIEDYRGLLMERQAARGRAI